MVCTQVHTMHTCQEARIFAYAHDYQIALTHRPIALVRSFVATYAPFDMCLDFRLSKMPKHIIHMHMCVIKTRVFLRSLSGLHTSVSCSNNSEPLRGSVIGIA